MLGYGQLLAGYPQQINMIKSQLPVYEIKIFVVTLYKLQSGLNNKLSQNLSVKLRK